jgi:exopolysaccharide production protein ExoZ
MKPKLDTLQACRGLAALWVVLFHVDALARLKGGSVFAGGVFATGYLGVDFFFVLSGFIIFWIHGGDIGSPQMARPYFLKRFVRIWPLLAAITTIKLLYAFAGGGGVPPEKLKFTVVLSSYLLLPQTVDPVIDAAWTLCYEALFYILFGLAIVLGRNVALAGAALWAGLCVATAMIAPRPPLLLAFVFSPLNLEFLLGVLVAYTVAKTRADGAWGLGLSGVAFIVLLAGLSNHAEIAASGYLAERVYYGLTFALLVLGMVNLESASRLRVPAPLRILGDASYSVYLAHSSFQVFLFVILMRLVAPPLFDNFWAIVIGASSVIGGLLVWRFLERPLLELGRRHIVGSRARERKQTPVGQPA